MNRSTAPNVALLLAGVALVAAPLAFPADVPPDRIEYYVEADWGDLNGQPNLAYENLSTDGKRVFDAARTNASRHYNATLATSPDRLTPPANGIGVYNVRYEDSYYLLQVKHLTYEKEFGTQVLPRMGALGLGLVLAALSAYRRVV